MVFANWSYKSFTPCPSCSIAIHKDRSSTSPWEKYTMLEKMVLQVCHGRLEVIQVGFFHVSSSSILAPHVLFQVDSYFCTIYPCISNHCIVLLWCVDFSQQKPNGSFQDAKHLIKTVSSKKPKASGPNRTLKAVLFSLLNQLFQCLQLQMALLHTTVEMVASTNFEDIFPKETQSDHQDDTGTYIFRIFWPYKYIPSRWLFYWVGGTSHSITRIITDPRIHYPDSLDSGMILITTNLCLV